MSVKVLLITFFSKSIGLNNAPTKPANIGKFWKKAKVAVELHRPTIIFNAAPTLTRFSTNSYIPLLFSIPKNPDSKLPPMTPIESKIPDMILPISIASNSSLIALPS